MSCPRTPTTTTSAATTTPNATPNEPYDASPGTLTVWATPSASTPSKPHRSPNAASLTAIFDADRHRRFCAAGATVLRCVLHGNGLRCASTRGADELQPCHKECRASDITDQTCQHQCAFISDMSHLG